MMGINLISKLMRYAFTELGFEYFLSAGWVWKTPIY